MSGIGFWELIILSLIGLIVLGPERLPRVANQLGSWLGQARRMTRVMRRQLEEEINLENELNIKPPSREPSTRPSTQTDADKKSGAAADSGDQHEPKQETDDAAEKPTSTKDATEETP